MERGAGPKLSLDVAQAPETSPAAMRDSLYPPRPLDAHRVAALDAEALRAQAEDDERQAELVREPVARLARKSRRLLGGHRRSVQQLVGGARSHRAVHAVDVPLELG